MTDLQEAFREAARREFAMVPDENELDYTFSPGFQRKMQRIIRAQVHGYWNMVNTLGKRIAIAAAIIVMLLTTAMAIKPIRERVIQFFVEVYEEYFSVTFGEKESGDIYSDPEQMIRYTLSWVPEGYCEVTRNELEALLTTVWTSDKNKDIMLIQGAGTHHITLNYTGEPLTVIELGALSIKQQCQTDTNVFIWEQDGCIFYLTIPTNIPQDEALQMITSLKQK